MAPRISDRGALAAADLLGSTVGPECQTFYFQLTVNAAWPRFDRYVTRCLPYQYALYLLVEHRYPFRRYTEKTHTTAHKPFRRTNVKPLNGLPRRLATER